jgi:hypothetical protein
MFSDANVCIEPSRFASNVDHGASGLEVCNWCCEHQGTRRYVWPQGSDRVHFRATRVWEIRMSEMVNL